MSACFGLAQGDIESEYITPFSSSLSSLSFPFFLLTCVGRAYAYRHHDIFVQKIPIFYDTEL